MPFEFDVTGFYCDYDDYDLTVQVRAATWNILKSVLVIDTLFTSLSLLAESTLSQISVIQSTWGRRRLRAFEVAVRRINPVVAV